MKFAIVEDSRSQAAVLEALLKSEGHEVDIFADGQSCLNALIETTFSNVSVNIAAGMSLSCSARRELTRKVRQTYCAWVPTISFPSPFGTWSSWRGSLRRFGVGRR